MLIEFCFKSNRLNKNSFVKIDCCFIFIYVIKVNEVLGNNVFW